MLVGRFGDTSGRPYLEGRLLIPSQNLSIDLSFLVDTGADHTYLMPGDARVGGLDYSVLHNRTTSMGVGGPARGFMERAIVAFADRKHLYVYELALTSAAPNRQMMDVPSLLGRDVLDQRHMTSGPAKKRLRFEVVSADLIMPLAPGVTPSPSPRATRR